MHSILDWDLGEIDAQATHVATDATTFDDLAGDLRADTDRTLDPMSGETVDAANSTVEQLVRRVFSYCDGLEQTAKVLDAFVREVSIQQTRLRTEVEAVRAIGGEVGDDGTVDGPPGSSPSTVNQLTEHSHAISDTLRAIRDSDRAAATLLGELYGAEAPEGPVAPNYDDNWGTETTVAGIAAGSQTQTLSALLQESAAQAGTSALGATRGLSASNAGFSVTAGLGAADGEDPRETVVAEVGGVLGGLGAQAAAGAAMGSLVPGIGTVSGALIMLGVGAIGAYATSGGIRTLYDDQRAVKYERGEA